MLEFDIMACAEKDSLSDFECGIHSGCCIIHMGVGMGKMDT